MVVSRSWILVCSLNKLRYLREGTFKDDPKVSGLNSWPPLESTVEGVDLGKAQF